jgi:hypothetical protein
VTVDGGTRATGPGPQTALQRRASPDLAASDPGLPRFAWLACGLVLAAGVWLFVSPPQLSSTGPAAAGGEVVDPAETLTGGSLFVREGCGACHATAGPSTALGPSLAGAYELASSRLASSDYTGFADTPEDYIREATLDHCVDRVPGYEYDCQALGDVGLRLSDEHVDRLVEFLVALPGGGNG